MANFTTDGACVPSYLGKRQMGIDAGSQDHLNDNVLRTGVITALVYPDMPESYSKRSLEYEVEVQYRSGSGTYTTSLYRGVVMSSVFGNGSDKVTCTLRPGARVVLMCISGDQQKAIIMGALESVAGKSSHLQSGAEGTNLYFSFNGVRMSVGYEGDFKLQFDGARNSDDTLTYQDQKDAVGTRLEIDRDGNMQLATKNPQTGEDEVSVKFNHVDKNLEIVTENDWKASINGAVDFTSQSDFLVRSKQGGMDINVANNVQITSSGVLVGEASEAWVLGTTFRQAQEEMHQQFIAQFTALATSIGTVATTLGAAVPLNAIPIVGGALAAIPLAATVVALAQAAAQLGQLAVAVGTYEFKGPMMLSRVNFGD